MGDVISTGDDDSQPQSSGTSLEVINLTTLKDWELEIEGHYNDLAQRQRLLFQDLLHKSSDQNETIDKLHQILNDQADRYPKGVDATIENLERSNEYLQEQNDKLTKEAARHQSALGDATNFRFSSDDPNSPNQLVNDIETLIDNLDAIIPKKKITVDVKNIDALLKYYGSHTPFTNPREQKVLLRGALKRLILQTILHETKKYLQQKRVTNDDNLEVDILYTANRLVNLMSEFAAKRCGVDSVTPCSPIKVRQQVYSVLGIRGFNTNIKHPFVNLVKDKILKLLNTYQIIFKDIKQVDEAMAQIVRQVVRIFQFRLNVQEPIGVYGWIKPGEELDPLLMIYPEIGDDSITDFVVDFCSFPLIGRDLRDSTKRKVYHRALVQIRKLKGHQPSHGVNRESLLPNGTNTRGSAK